MMTIFNIGIKGIIEKEGRILLVHDQRNGKDMWDVPGGRIDENESVEETLTRELQEELPGITNIRIGELLSAKRVPGMVLGDKGLFLVCYKVEADLPSIVRTSEEHDQFEWVILEEAVNQVQETVRPALEKLLTQL